MTAIRFFHMADLHLDSPFKGLFGLSEHILKNIRSSTFDAFDKIIQKAIQEKPDFLLIVGDIYDGENRSLQAQRRFQDAMEKLFQHNIPVIVSYGNHDHLNGTWTRFSLPSNVYELPAETSVVQLKIRDQQVNIYGFSYHERHLRESVIESYPIAQNQQTIHIGMLHGSEASNTTHDVYAPFTKQQLLEKNYHYWALGHIHKRQLLHQNPPIVYPGNIQSRHRKEQGLKGYYDVTLSRTSAELDFIPTSTVVYSTVEVDCKNVIHANELLKRCAEAITVNRTKYGASVIELHLQNIDEQTEALFEHATVDAWLETVREAEEGIEPMCWVQKLVLQKTRKFYEHTATTQSVVSLMEQWDSNEWKDILKDLYQYAGGARLIEPLTDKDIENLTNSAQALLAEEIQRA
ncbi:DNA repair exonuclease [Lysinibacillus irui]|uniref:DNA repair exonuclease n=1 Tax=Lysinibacillus irui TaxID=2998077 RepID=A0AAJ5UQZ1_9BACI|nr:MULTISPECIES: DNA repair exonuclease [Lysinibacillus]MEA0553687.1 DNA repair exonuclease [Lysinibacillus irui]MEA0976071.1 DNA repair exonuclease [Lysinibacillus irui]MEA1042225.1 DNA repair exonuclease [Lysinibacillus irui]WDV06251.1 DNA repair exonuclease [Lysinibacillus irui]